jgi:hypothetical protein
MNWTRLAGIRLGQRKANPGDAAGLQEICIDERLALRDMGGREPKKPLVTDPVKTCFECHTPRKANDYTFSTYLH